MIFRPIFFAAALCLIACGSTRENPFHVQEPVVKETIDYDEGQQDAGLKSYDSTGYTVSDGWLRGYRRLLDLHWKDLPARNQIKPADYMIGIEARGPHRYHITFEVYSRYTALNFIDNNPH